MKRFYSDETRKEAIRRVVVDRRSVSSVAREMRVGEGTVYFWVRRHRQLVPRDARLPEFRHAILQIEARLRRLQSRVEAGLAIETA